MNWNEQSDTMLISAREAYQEQIYLLQMQARRLDDAALGPILDELANTRRLLAGVEEELAIRASAPRSLNWPIILIYGASAAISIATAVLIWQAWM